MEQSHPSTHTDLPTAVPRPYPDRATDPATDPVEAESSQSSQPNSLDQLSNSVLSLRFPRPLGNRQLTNWVSSSSPDIMQRENFPDDDPNLAELGYDVIGTDGESQAESVTGSLDYQKPDDVQSLAGTDTGTDADTNEIDTDSSDDDEEAVTLSITAADADTTPVKNTDDDDDDADVETLLNRSLENPTDFSQHGIPPLVQLEHFDEDQTTQEPIAHDTKSASENTKETSNTWAKNELRSRIAHEYNLALRYLRQNRRALIVLSISALMYGLAFAGKVYFFSPPTPKVLSTVPVASISSSSIPSPAGHSASTSAPTPTPTIIQTQKALQTTSVQNNPTFIQFGKDRVQADPISQSLGQTLCSADLYDRNEIIVKIPQNLKSTWLSKDAILIAVSRSLYDIPTKVSTVKEGFLIEVPLEEAHGVLAVSIVTTSKPKIQETFHVDFGGNKLIVALDAGKQLVKEFAQKFVDTVNGTTAWVEETYIPALDVVSKQVCSQTSSVSDSLLQGLRDAGNVVRGLPSQVAAHIEQLLDESEMARRRQQSRQELQEGQAKLTEGIQTLRETFALRYLSAQLRSKLWWLRLQGNSEEYQRYLSKAEVYLGEKVADAQVAKQSRAERVKKQIRAWRKHDGRDAGGLYANKDME
ncbi:hypothetical protein M426DRAFT_8266 [Hypoxylon sp. CI-4A]|nr:hypothetical protein M426DRAFT_8266 [Hypoxylon sp. CI-4A]